MKNYEKYPTADERAKGFEDFCSEHNCEECPLNVTTPDCGSSRGQFSWLELEADEEKTLPCPFCGSNTEVKPYVTVRHVSSHWIECTNCNYRSEEKYNRDSAIAAHNLVARAVGAGQKDG